MDTIYMKLTQMTKADNLSYTTLAKHILESDNPKKLKLKTLQLNCHVSNATILRFCKALGTSGFSELKYLLAQEREQKKECLITKHSELFEMSTEHFDNIEASFIATRRLLSPDLLETIVEVLHQSKVINIYALGGTFLVAQDFELKLDRIGKFCKSYNDKNLQFFASKNLTENDLAIGITYSAKSKSVIDSLIVAKEQGAKTLLITSEKNTEFEHSIDFIVYINSTDHINRLVTTTSRLTMLYIIDLIYYRYIKKNQTYIEKKLAHNSYL
ncbi:MurR/RpiR family transcriptional regulator [Vallitaleaceae bacterium 9-2]